MAWRTTWNGNWKTSLAAALTSYTVKLGPISNIEGDDSDASAIWCSTEWDLRPSESPSGCRVYDASVYLGVVIHGMDEGDSVDDLWDALDTIEDTVWTLLAPGTFRNTNQIDEILGIKLGEIKSRVGALKITLRVRKV